jgi:hypothetical protein
MRTLLDAITAAAGAGQSQESRFARKDHGVDCKIVDADTSITAITVDLEGTFDPPEIPDAQAKWVQLGQHVFTSAELTALYAMWVILDTPPIKRIRANITTLTGEGAGDTITVRHQVEGEE